MIVASLVLAVPLLLGAIGTETPGVSPDTVVVEPSVFRREYSRSGVVEPQDAVVVQSECFWKTHLLSILPEGTRVKKGEVVAVLDSSEIEEYARARELLLIKYRNRLDAALKDEELLTAENERRRDKAEFAHESAAARLKEYITATHPQDMEDLQNEVRLIGNEILSAEETLNRVNALCIHGLETKASVRREQAVFDRLCQRREKLTADLTFLKEFGHPRKLLEHRATTRNLKQNVVRTQLKNSLSEIRVNRNILSYRRVLQIYERYYQRAIHSIEACTLRAPCDGQVIYAQSWASRGRGDTVEEGASVRFRQEIFQIPDEHRRSVQVPLNETQAWSLQPHTRVSVRIQGLEAPVPGSVTRIARYPKIRSSWTPDEKDYWIKVDLHPSPEQLESIAPRADAEVVFLMSEQKEVLQVPITAVAGQCDCQFVLVDGSEGIVPRRVAPGDSNGESVCIDAGLEPGERVVARLQEQQCDQLMQRADELLQR